MVETLSYSATRFYGIFIFIQSSIYQKSHWFVNQGSHKWSCFYLTFCFNFFLCVCIFAGLVIEPRDLLMLSKHSNPSLSSSLPLFGLHLKSELIWGDVLREGNLIKVSHTCMKMSQLNPSFDTICVNKK